MEKRQNKDEVRKQDKNHNPVGHSSWDLFCNICRISNIYVSVPRHSIISGGSYMNYGEMIINIGACETEGGFPDDRRPQPPFPRRKERGWTQ